MRQRQERTCSAAGEGEVHRETHILSDGLTPYSIEPEGLEHVLEKKSKNGEKPPLCV
jgi:hypothetical protein